MSRTIIWSNFSAGVGEIQQVARKEQSEILRSRQYNREFSNFMIDNDEKLELMTRIFVRSRFMDVLGGKLERDLLEGLKTVFFDIVYPTPPEEMND